LDATVDEEVFDDGCFFFLERVEDDAFDLAVGMALSED